MDEDKAFHNYLEWLSLDYELQFIHDDTGKSFSRISPKRGNRQYAIKKWRKLQNINDGMKGMLYDLNVPNHRSIHRKAHLLLITLTFSQDITRENAWHSITAQGQELNRFKANLTKIFGSKATITVKEAQANGYPAPHILVMLDRPVKVYRHAGKKGGVSWRLSSRETLQRVKNCWKWGFSDIEAIIKDDIGRFKGYGSPVGYLWKYLTKTFDVKESLELLDHNGIQGLPPKKRIAVYTHLWNKLFQSRDIYISPAFKNRINNLPQEPKEEPSSWKLLSVNSSPAFMKLDIPNFPSFHRVHDEQGVIPPG